MPNVHISQVKIDLLWDMKGTLRKHPKEGAKAINNMVRKLSESSDYKKTTHLISVAAKKMLVEKCCDGNLQGTINELNSSRELLHEHVVPCSVLSKIIATKCFSGKRALADYLNKMCLRAWVTGEENRRLPKSEMPEGWDGDDPMSRYKDAGIKVEDFDFQKLEEDIRRNNR